MALVKTCPTCGFGNPTTSPFCSQCGVSLVAVAPSENIPAAPIDEQPLAEKIVCPDCKAEIDVGSKRCVYCDCALQGDGLETCKVELAWPWGKEILIGTMRIGRYPPAPEGLIQAISAHGYDSIS